MNASRVRAGAYDELLFAAASDAGSVLRIARITQATGAASEVASVPTTGTPTSLSFGVVNGRIFLFSAEGSSGLRIYEFAPGGGLSPAGVIPGTFDLLVVKGDPAIVFAHRREDVVQTFVEAYDTKFLVSGGTPLRAFSLLHSGDPEVPFRKGLEAVVKSSGGVLTAYVYRLVSPTAFGEECRRPSRTSRPRRAAARKRRRTTTATAGGCRTRPPRARR
jgi:hypothetical protein